MSVGDLIEVGPPCGDFFYNMNNSSNHPIVLLAGGVGITLIMSILLTILDKSPQQQIVLIHACLNEAVQPFKPMLDQLAIKYDNLTVHYRYSEPANSVELRDSSTSSYGFVTPELIKSLISTHQAEYYFCGPKPFMININQQLIKWDIPKSQIHFEFFGPLQEFVITPQHIKEGL